MLIQSWLDVLMYSLMSMLDSIIGFIPNLIGAILLLIIGIVVAKALEFTVEKIISLIKLDSLLKKIELDQYLRRADISLDSGKLFGTITYWIILIIFVVGIAEILGLLALSIFITTALRWVFASLVSAILILLVTAFIAQTLKQIVSASVKGAKLHSAKFLGSATWWIVMIFGAVASLNQLGVDTALLEGAVMSFVVAIPITIGIAVGLAFGLGGKKQAEQILERLEDRLEHH